MTDRELLELAAKAAGAYKAVEWKDDGVFELNGYGWNPLTDDGDALRLAVKLRLDIWTDTCHHQSAAIGRNNDDEEGEVFSEFEDHNNDPYAATRRAIVRAAAEIGKEMK